MKRFRFIPPIARKQCVETGVLAVGICLVVGLRLEGNEWDKTALALTVTTLLVPWFFYPIALVWFALGNALSSLSSRLLLTVLFVGLVIPVGWLRQRLGKDPLRVRRFKKGRESVFVTRDHTFDASDLQHPF